MTNDPHADAVTVAYTPDQATPDARERAFWRWWLPYFAEAVSTHRLTRSEGMRALLNAARHILPDAHYEALEVGGMLDMAVRNLDAHHLACWVRMKRAVDHMFDAFQEVHVIRAEIRRIAREANLSGFDWEPLFRDRARAWQRRYRRSRP